MQSSAFQNKIMRVTERPTGSFVRINPLSLLNPLGDRNKTPATRNTIINTLISVIYTPEPSWSCYCKSADTASPSPTPISLSPSSHILSPQLTEMSYTPHPQPPRSYSVVPQESVLSHGEQHRGSVVGEGGDDFLDQAKGIELTKEDRQGSTSCLSARSGGAGRGSREGREGGLRRE
jgi:hypothetical protein